VGDNEILFLFEFDLDRRFFQEDRVIACDCLERDVFDLFFSAGGPAFLGCRRIMDRVARACFDNVAAECFFLFSDVGR
jgi:hypothetical protein